MGRPALLGSHPRGPQYRGVQVPPHYGNRPRWRKKRTTYLTQCKNPKSIVPALSRSEMTKQDRRNHSRHQGKANRQSSQTELRNITDTCTKQYITPERCPGGTTRRWLGSSPHFRSEKQIWPFFIAKCIATATVSLTAEKSQPISQKESLAYSLTA